MANGISPTSQPLIPIFDGDKYEFWSIKMKTLFQSQELWEFIEDGYDDKDKDASKLKENKKKDAKALFFLQQSVSDSLFSRIASATTSKMAWQTLKTEFQGSTKVIEVKLQSLRSDFETLSMDTKETVQDYLSRASSIVNRMRSYGETITDQTVVKKILRTLNTRFDLIVPAIEESHDLSTYSFAELMSSLQNHEERMNRKQGVTQGVTEEKAFQVKEEASSRGNSRGGYRGRGRGGRTGGRGRGRGRSQEQRHFNQKSSIQCHYCKKFGHKEAECWSKQKDESTKANLVETDDTSEMLFMAHYPDHTSDQNLWFIDSGCSNHMSNSRSLFETLDVSKKSEVRLGDNKTVQVDGKGTIAICSSTGKKKLLHDVFFVPSLAHNLLSVGQLMNDGLVVVFDAGQCVIRDKKSGLNLVSVSMTKNRMFPLDVSIVEDKALIVKGGSDSDLWHLRYGHLHLNGLKLLSQKEMVLGLPHINKLEFCEGCVLGKHSKKPFPVGKSRRATECLELVHADLCGPMRTESLNGSRYFLLFTDDYTRMSWVYFLTLKSEALDMFKKFKAFVEKQSGCFIKKLRTDNGGEFCSNDFDAFCEELGIYKQLTAPYTPEQNGIAERKNRTIVEMARSMLKARGLPNQFWAEAVATSVYLRNISPTKAVMNQTPYEAWHNVKPLVSHLKVFGCIAYALVKSSRHKLENKSEKCVFLGYSLKSKAYRLYNPISGKIIISRDVLFNESASWS